MRVLFFLPNVSAYLDRVRLLMEVSKGIDCLVLLVGRNDAEIDISGFGRFQIVEVGFRPGWRPYNIWRACRVATKIIHEYRIDIVHDTFATLLPLFYRRGHFPGVHFVESLFILSGWRLRHVWNDTPTWKLLTTRSTATMYPNAWLEQRVCKVADAVVLQAPGLKEQLLSFTAIDSHRIHVITNSFDADWWASGPGTGDSLDEDSTALRLLSTGGVGRPHGIFVLIDTLVRLRGMGYQVRLTIVGQWGPFVKKKVLRLIQEHCLSDAISLLGRVPRESMRELFHTHDLCIYQCNNDGSPRSMLEAIGAGIPTIASRQPGVDVLDPDGRSIGFTEFGDVDRTVELVEDYRMHRSEWLARAKRGQQAVARRFCTSAVAKDVVSFYDSLQQLGATGATD